MPPELTDAIRRGSKPSRPMAKRIRGEIKSKALIVLITVTREMTRIIRLPWLPDEQQSIIRYWTRHEADISFVAQKPHDADSNLGIEIGNPASLPLFERSESSKLGMGF